MTESAIATAGGASGSGSATVLQNFGQVTVLAGQDGGPTIHSYMSPEAGDLVCSVIVETANRLVIIDGQLLMPYAQAVRMYAERLGKPIDRVIVTHAHPDHFSGLEAFADLPIHATGWTTYAIGNWGQGIMDFKRQTLGDRTAQYATKLVVPAVAVNDGSEMIDGVEFVFRAVKDSEQAEVLTVELPAQKTIITSDIVYNGVHPAVGDKNGQNQFMWDGWLAALADLKSRGYQWIVPGHGVPIGPEVLDVMTDYISTARQVFEGGTTPDAFRATMKERFPKLGGAELIEYSVFFLFFSQR